MSGRAAPGEEVVACRGDRIESGHRVRIAVADAAGALHHALGDVEELVFLRSAAKPFQAAAALRAGALDDASDEELAVVCASHGGEDDHVRIVAGLLRRLGFDETALRCGTHPPIHRETAERLGAAVSALHSNCSGKHAGMLALARRLRVTPGTYLDPEGPVQRLVLEVVAEACGMDAGAVVRATDGCSAPVFAVPLRVAARAYARLARPADAPARLRGPLERIARVMAAHPRLVAGSGRFDTRLMAAAGGRLVAKAGAEAVQGIADRETGRGLFLKIADGGARAVPPAAVAALGQLGWLSREALDELADLARPVLLNHAGLAVGHLEADFLLAAAG